MASTHPTAKPPRTRNSVQLTPAICDSPGDQTARSGPPQDRLAPRWLPLARQDRTPVRSRRDLSFISPVAGRRRTLPDMAKCPETRDCLRAVDHHKSQRLDISSERCSFTCAPTATRTRDLLLRRHSRSVARRRPARSDVPFRRSENGWTRPGVALRLWPLAPSLAPMDLISNANVRMVRARSVALSAATTRTLESHIGPKPAS